jgi:hypothetical protein
MNRAFTRYQQLPSIDALLVPANPVGRDIALRCPRPRISGNLGTAERDADSAAVQGANFASAHRSQANEKPFRA